MTAVAVSGTLSTSVLVSWDIPELVEFMSSRDRKPDKADALAAMTWMRQQHQRETLEAQPTGSEAELAQVPEHSETDLDFLSNLDDSLFTPPGTARPALTRAQTRENRRHYRLK